MRDRARRAEAPARAQAGRTDARTRPRHRVPERLFGVRVRAGLAGPVLGDWSGEHAPRDALVLVFIEKRFLVRIDLRAGLASERVRERAVGRTRRDALARARIPERSVRAQIHFRTAPTSVSIRGDDDHRGRVRTRIDACSARWVEVEPGSALRGLFEREAVLEQNQHARLEWEIRPQYFHLEYQFPSDLSTRSFFLASPEALAQLKTR